MRTLFSKLAFMVALGLALTFTFSCSQGDGEDDQLLANALRAAENMAQSSGNSGGGWSSSSSVRSGGYSSSSGNNIVKSSSSVDCSTYRRDYDTARSAVEKWKKELASEEDTYRNLVSRGASVTILTNTANIIAQTKNSLRNAEDNLANVKRQATNAGCSV